MAIPDADIRSVARHEAAHAVIWWWWVNRPEGMDYGSCGWFDCTTIRTDPERPSRRGYTHMDAGAILEYAHWRSHLEHLLAGILAGPESNRLLGIHDGSHYDETAAPQYAKRWLARHDKTGRVADSIVDEAIDLIRPQVAVLLQTLEVVAMVSAIADALLDRETLTGKDAIEIMRDALGNL
ncbi:MAG: hypothetical protein GXP36_12055 [Actinobacteria bacterium]|nr:hypothetical protein [Actinomycetota bacterium]